MHVWKIIDDTVIWKNKSLIVAVNSVLNDKIFPHLNEILVYKLNYFNYVKNR